MHVREEVRGVRVRGVQDVGCGDGTARGGEVPAARGVGGRGNGGERGHGRVGVQGEGERGGIGSGGERSGVEVRDELERPDVVAGGADARVRRAVFLREDGVSVWFVGQAGRVLLRRAPWSGTRHR